MAESAEAVIAPPLPTSEQIERARAFTREPFVLEGEDPAVVLAPGDARRRALDDALKEIEAGADKPSVAWRRKWSLLLGLERLLAVPEPVLKDGTVLNAHQVDALSGTLTALLAESQRNGGHQGNGAVAVAQTNGTGALLGLPDDALAEVEDEEEVEEDPIDWAESEAALDSDVDQLPDQPEDPNAAKRFWFEHATGAGKTVAALGFVEGSRTGGILILTHRRNLVDQFHGELRDRGYRDRIAPALLKGARDPANGPVTVETYQWFVRNQGKVSDAYTIVICDEAHTALGEKTSAGIRKWDGPIFIGMTATGALIARHVADLFPTQTSRFDLAQAARRGVIAPLRDVRIPPGPGVRTIAKVPLRKGEVDMEFDQEMLAELLDQAPFNVAIADLYKTRFNGLPGVIYAAGVRHAYNVAQAMRDAGLKAQGVSGETPKRELAQILADYERGEIDVLVNAQLLAEGWNSPRATVCMHLAPTASKRIYQQRVGRVTRRHPGKEAGIVVDFVHPATKHDDPVVTLHSLLDRDVYRGGAIVVGPVRRGRGRRLRVERRVLPVTAEENRRIEVFERELWRIAVEHLDWGEQIQWAALAGARVAPTGWRRARAMLHFDSSGELKRHFLVTAMQRNRNAQLRLRALQEIAASKDADAIDRAVDIITGWPREEKREGVKVVLTSLADKRIGRRDQANNWIWRCADMTREVHEEYAVQRWPETKRLLGLLVNSSGSAHARNARRLVHAARQQDRRLAAALLAAALAHTPEAGEVINGARMRMSRKPAALARELLRNFPKGGKSRTSRRRRKKSRTGEAVASEAALVAAGAVVDEGLEDVVDIDDVEGPAFDPGGAAQTDDSLVTAVPLLRVGPDAPTKSRSRRSRSRRRLDADPDAGAVAEVVDRGNEPEAGDGPDVPAEPEEPAKPRKRAPARRKPVAAKPVEAEGDAAAPDAPAEPEEPAKPRKRVAARKPAAKATKPAAKAAKPAAKKPAKAAKKPAAKAAKPAAKKPAKAVKPAATAAEPAKAVKPAKATKPAKAAKPATPRKAAATPRKVAATRRKATPGAPKDPQLTLDTDADAA